MLGIGNVSESAVATALLARGWVVSLPMGDGARYDLVGDIGSGTLLKIQVKTARLVRDKYISFSTSSGFGPEGRRKSYRGQVDYIMAYCPDDKEVYVCTPEEVPTTEAKLPLKPRTRKPACDYLIQEVLGKELI